MTAPVDGLTMASVGGLLPGPDLDRLVHQRVFGARLSKRANAPRYSTDIAAAWRIFELLRERFPELYVGPQRPGGWMVGRDQGYDGLCLLYQRDYEMACEAATAPHAICLAGLVAAENGWLA